MCGICLCYLDVIDDIYRFVCCGYVFDRKCIIQQLKFVEVLLKCVREDCGEFFVLRDLQNLLNQRERKKFVFSVLDVYVRCNFDFVKYCLMFDCWMVYCVLIDGRSYKCGVCLVDICILCYMQFYSGLMCVMFKLEENVEEDFKVWMGKDFNNRKYCFKCSVLIEKNEGCNYMECLLCKLYMCWLCFLVFVMG